MQHALRFYYKAKYLLSADTHSYEKEDAEPGPKIEGPLLRVLVVSHVGTPEAVCKPVQPKPNMKPVL